MLGITPEDFIRLIKDGTAEKVLTGIQAYFKDKPAQAYDVVRQSQAGPVHQQVSLPGMLAELTDAMKVQSALTYEVLLLRKQELVEIKALTTELKENRKLAKKMARERDEDDE